MKHIKVVTLSLFAVCVGSAQASSTVSSYSAGVAPTAGTTGAADPISQGWIPSTESPGSYNYGADSTIGGWRITDGTSGGNFFYSQALSPTAALGMTYSDWTATWTTVVSADAVSSAGVPNGVDEYYIADPTRQNNNALWLEVAGQYTYILTHKTDANGNVLLNDGVNDFTITLGGNELAQELGAGAPSANYITYTLSSVGGVVSLSDSLGGSHGVVATHPTVAPTEDRVVWGAYSWPGQGSTVWNDLSVVVVPEPTSSLLLGFGLLALMLRRRSSKG